MINTKIKILFTYLSSLILTIQIYGQSIKENKSNIHVTNDEIPKLLDKLKGKWELNKIISYQNGDTIIQEPSSAPIGINTSKPITTIIFDSLQTFQITQFCMKCPYLFWEGKCQINIKPLNGFESFYIQFIDNKDKFLKKKQKSLTLEFNGFLTFLDTDLFQIIDKNGCCLIYERKKE
jgi:hypothetical protein